VCEQGSKLRREEQSGGLFMFDVERVSKYPCCYLYRCMWLMKWSVVLPVDDTCICLQVADNAEPMAKEFNEQQLQPAAEYIAKNFEKEARRLAKEVGPLAEGLPKAMRRAVELNKVTCVCLLYILCWHASLADSTGCASN